MRKIFYTIILCTATLAIYQFTGSAQGEKNESTEITPQEVLPVIRSHVTGKSGMNNVYTIYDPLYKLNRRLRILRLESWVRKTDGKYYSRGLFQDLDNNEVLDIDFYVGYNDKGTVGVLDKSIHSVGGKARYYYDSEGKKVPL
jgi:hypothetical protein